MTAAARQKNDIPGFLARHSEWIYRTIVLSMTSGLFVAVMWLNSKYVTREEFDKTQSDVSEMKTTLRIMAEQNKVNERQDLTLHDLEQRLRIVEQKTR